MEHPQENTQTPSALELLGSRSLNANQKATLAKLLLKETERLWREREKTLSAPQAALLHETLTYAHDERMGLPETATPTPKETATRQLLLGVEMLASARLGCMEKAGRLWKMIGELEKHHTRKRRPNIARGVMGAVQRIGQAYLSWEESWQTPRDAKTWRERRSFALAVQLGNTNVTQKARAICVIIASHLELPSANRQIALCRWSEAYKKLESANEKVRGNRAQAKLLSQADTLWTQESVAKRQTRDRAEGKTSARKLMARLAQEFAR